MNFRKASLSADNLRQKRRRASQGGFKSARVGLHDLLIGSACGRLWTRLVALYNQYPVPVLDFRLIRISDGQVPSPALDLAEADHGPGGVVLPVPFLQAALRPIPAEPPLPTASCPAR